jgi:ATP-dependent 26S proteasome regulatory subunit
MKAQSKRIRFPYKDIEVLEKQIQSIREMIELTLKYPEVFNRLGIELTYGQ